MPSGLVLDFALASALNLGTEGEDRLELEGA